MEFNGVDVGDRWQQLSDVAEQHVHDQELVFASLHYLIALSATNSPGATEFTNTLSKWRQTDGSQGLNCANRANRNDLIAQFS